MLQIVEIQRTFVFEQQQTLKSQIITTLIRTNHTIAYLLDVLYKIGNPIQLKFKIFDNQNSKFIKLDDIIQEEPYAIPFKYIELSTTLLKYTTSKKSLKNHSELHQENDSSSVSSVASNLSQPKKERSRQRTINEVIQLVKKWREIHLNSGIDGKKRINLQEAAKILGISKKSLDDYYYQLRIGQVNNFDFNANLNQKIGTLRDYIKDYRSNKDKKNYLKHPKKLKIIEQSQIPKLENNLHEDNISEKMQAQENNWFKQQSNNDLIKSYQNQFFNDFQYLLGEPNDPIFSFEKSFLKKNKNFGDIFFDQDF